MTLTVRRPQTDELSRLRMLYESSFPESERFDFDKLLRQTDDTNGFRVICDDGFCGLTYLVYSDAGLFILYLAVSPERRNAGIGSKVLTKLKSENPGMCIFLNVEPPEGEDIEIRKRRIGFYGRNGFSSNGLITTPDGERYELLSFGGRPEPEKIGDFFESLGRTVE